MADDVLASRREARRRKILDNCENRLLKITGRNEISDESLKETPLISQNGASLKTVRNGPIQIQSHTNCNFQRVTRSSDIAEAKPSKSEKQNKLNPYPTFSHKSNFHVIYVTKFHLVLLAVIAKLLLTFNYGFIFGENLLVPLSIVEISDILLLKTYQHKKSSPEIFGTLLLLSGITPETIAIFTNLLELMTKIVQDLCIYVFSFVTFHAFMSWQEGLVNIS